ncbi:MAG TPA: histidine kinase [Vicinamibacterales bacterium]|nr:histidine kinase [Vicinamibacterales bacterium]
MTLISLVFLFVYLFGAYAYGAATVYGLRQSGPIWGVHREYAPGVRGRIDRASLGLFVLSTVWFVLHVLIEFRSFMGFTGDSWLGMGTLLVYAFPPVIVHTVYLESHYANDAPVPPIFRMLLQAMYVVSLLTGVYVIAAVLEKVPHPEPLGLWIGISIGALFTLSSVYSTALMTRRRLKPATPDQRRLRVVMISLFVTLSVVFIALVVMREQRMVGMLLEGIARSSPIYFMIASIYFENRFEFYDLIIKRAVLMLLSVIVLGIFLAATLPFLQLLPDSAARPWLFAAALAPVAMVMPWLVARTERWLDRLWLGREFTPVDAVKHVLAAMQPATDEATLIQAAEARLNEIFGAKIAVLVGSRTLDESTVEVEVKLTSPVSGATVRIAVLKEAQGRRLMSEDLVLLRSLGSVFGFMLENIRLQRKRVEQEQVAQELQLQSSKSELKALRAQINPHFLFNALNAIASLIHTDPGRADEAVEQLAEVFRYTLRRSNSEWAPLDQELTFARAYLDVEQARFGDRLTCTIDSDHLPPAPSVPSMLLQTLLENAVKHGVSQARGPGRIDVVVRTTSDQVTMEVRNTGPGAESHGLRSREGEGFGLHSVRERLKGHFGERATFRLTRDETAGVTVAKISMPHVRIAA